MKKAELKQFMIEKGERVGLYVAAGIAGLLLILTLFMPGRGLMSGSASEKVKSLEDQAQSINSKRASATPQQKHLPSDIKAELARLNKPEASREDYLGNSELMRSVQEVDNKRHPPAILKPTEFTYDLVRARLRAVEFEYENVGEGRIPTQVWVVKGGAGMMGGGAGMMGGGAGMMGGGNDGTKPPMPAGGGAQAGGPVLQGNFAEGLKGSSSAFNNRNGRPSFNPRSGKALRPDDAENAAKIELVSIADAVKSKANLAVKVLPRRMVIFTGSFPYKAQVELHRAAMKLGTHGEVLTEKVRGDKKKDGTFEEWSAFQFRGIEIERMTLTPDGKETKWEKVPELLDEYKRIAFWVAREFEKDDPKLKPILNASTGLWMALPKQIEGQHYPEQALKLNSIKTALANLQDKGKDIIETHRLGNQDDIDPFEIGAQQTTEKKPGNVVNPEKPPTPSPDSGTPTPGAPGDDQYGRIAGKGEQTKINETPIEHCMIRFIDPTVEEGKAYRYRIRVKMANPNYSTQPEKRKDTYPDYARKKELICEEWSEIPNAVVVPNDEHLYVVDQYFDNKADEAKFGPAFTGKPRGRRAAETMRIPDGDQVALQIHRWFDYYRPNPDRGEDKPVGEWLIADRLLVERGGFLRQVFPTEVPIKNLNQHHPELDTHTWANKDLQELIKRYSGTYPHYTKTTMPVVFGDESVLVDFTGSKATFLRQEKDPNPKAKEPRTVAVQDDTAVEVLIQRPDGSVIARNNLEDAYSTERKERYEHYVDGIKKLTEKKSGGSGTTPTGGSPFGTPPKK